MDGKRGGSGEAEGDAAVEGGGDGEGGARGAPPADEVGAAEEPRGRGIQGEIYRTVPRTCRKWLGTPCGDILVGGVDALWWISLWVTKWSTLAISTSPPPPSLLGEQKLSVYLTVR